MGFLQRAKPIPLTAWMLLDGQFPATVAEGGL